MFIFNGFTIENALQVFVIIVHFEHHHALRKFLGILHDLVQGSGDYFFFNIQEIPVDEGLLNLVEDFIEHFGLVLLLVKFFFLIQNFLILDHFAFIVQFLRLEAAVQNSLHLSDFLLFFDFTNKIFLHLEDGDIVLLIKLEQLGGQSTATNPSEHQSRWRHLPRSLRISLNILLEFLHFVGAIKSIAFLLHL